MTYYRINVTKTDTQGNQSHFFATADHSLRSEWQAQECWKLFKEKFPESEGYKMTMAYWTLSGKYINPETMKYEAD